MMKRCYKCRRQKPLSDFYRDERAKDALKSECKACFGTMGKKYAQANRDRINARSRESRAANRKPKPQPQSLIVGLKVCRECGMIKLLKDYCADSKSRDRLRYECKTCQRAYHKSAYGQALALNRSRKYAAANRPKRRAAYRDWYRENTSRALAASKKWASENPERRKQLRREWYLANREQELVRASSDAARRKGAEGFYTREDIDRIFKQQRGQCACCGEKLNHYHKDHIIPVSKKGTNWARNIQLLCEFCNLSKKDRDPVEFMQSRGMLL